MVKRAVSMTIKGQHVEDLCGDEIGLYLDCDGGYTNLQMQPNGMKHIHTHGININFLLWILYDSYIRC